MTKRQCNQNILSRQWMQQALIQLLTSKELNEISVSELTRKAGVARVTFYRNYVEMSDVIFDYLKMSNFGLDSSDPNSLYLPHFIRSYFVFFQDNLLLFQCIQKNALLPRLYMILEEQINSNALILLSSYGFESPYEISALVGMLVKILLDWTRDGMKESIETMTLIVYNIVTKFACIP